MTSTVIGLVSSSLVTFLQIYLILLFIRVILSWFPNVNWMSPPFSILSQLTDPYLNIFRSLIPPLGGLDLSPILAFLLLSFLMNLLEPLVPARLYRASKYWSHTWPCEPAHGHVELASQNRIAIS